MERSHSSFRGRRPIGALALALVLPALPLLLGCSKLEARFRARDGVDLYHRGDYGAAAAKLAEAARLDEQMPTIQLNLGTANLAIFRGTGSKTPEGQAAADGAIKAYERYLDLKPKDERVKLSLVQTFVDTGRYEDAVAFFRSAVDRTPPDPQALHTLAVVAQKCGRPDEAEKWHEKQIAAAPSDVEGYLALGVLLWEELHAHPEWPVDQRMAAVQKALGVLKKAIELTPSAPNPYTYANLVYREQALSESSEDGKRAALEEANRYYQMALERQKHGS